MKNEALAQQIAEAKKIAEAAYNSLVQLTRECKCSIATKKKPDFGGRYPDWGFAFCETCGKSFDYYCPDSPDHTCHYYSYMDDGNGKRFVRLVDGTEYYLPDDYDCTQEDAPYQGCIFCGEPDERK
jgi:hypothetical protein